MSKNSNFFQNSQKSLEHFSKSLKVRQKKLIISEKLLLFHNADLKTLIRDLALHRERSHGRVGPERTSDQSSRKHRDYQKDYRHVEK
jgi:hypothetical protein